METLDVIKLANAAAQGKRPYFFSQPDVDRLLAIVMALVGELAVTRERLDTVERLLAAKSVLDRSEVEGYRPTEIAERERGQAQIEYIARVLRILEQEADALRRGASEQSAEDVACELAGREGESK
jgi:hypothetical protein